jgi:arylsulfatase A-like enzyme
MRWDAMGCAGNRVIRTPHLDALAAGGVRFRWGFAPNPVCCPSRASLITGQYPHSHGVRDNCFPLAAHLKTLPGLLREAGYRTVSVGKMHFEPIDAPYGFERRRIAEDKSGSYDDHYRRYLADKGLRHLSPDVMWRKPDSGALLGMTSPLSEEDYIDSWCGRETLEEIRRRDGRPFFLWLGFPSPHVPTDPPAPWATMYSAEDVIPPPVDPEEWKTKPPEQQPGRLRFDEKAIRHFLAHYYAMVSLIDKWVGAIVEALKETGQYENTLIVFSSDHGDYAGEHGKIFKGHCLYEGLLRVPFLLHWPARLARGQVSDSLVELVDVLPTFLDYAGVEIPWGVQGRSLRPLLAGGEGKTESLREFAFAEYFYQKMVRTPEWKLIYYAGKPYGELFNLKEDPHEFHNRYDDPACRKVRAELEQGLLDFLVATEHPLPEAEDFWKNSLRKNSAYGGLSEPGRGSL